MNEKSAQRGTVHKRFQAVGVNGKKLWTCSDRCSQKLIEKLKAQKAAQHNRALESLLRDLGIA
jgi:hypothetical protein